MFTIRHSCHLFIQATSRESISSLLHCVKFSHNFLLSSDGNLCLQFAMAVQRHVVDLESSGTGKKPRLPRNQYHFFFLFCFHSKANIT